MHKEFDVGEIAIVRNDLRQYVLYGKHYKEKLYADINMVMLSGNKVAISTKIDVDNSGIYLYKVEGCSSCWNEDMLEKGDTLHEGFILVGRCMDIEQPNGMEHILR